MCLNKPHLKNSHSAENQKGVTLLLAILILSSVMAISFSIATILFIEVRTSADLLRTENTILASQGVGEEVIFRIKRQVPECPLRSPYCYSGPGYTQTIGRNAIEAPETKYADPSQLVKISVADNSFENTEKRYIFYNPDDVMGGSGYGRISVTVINSAPSSYLKVYICEFDPNFTGEYETSGPACSNPSSENSYWRYIDNLSVSGNHRGDYFIDPTLQQELILVNTYGDSDIFAQIDTYASDGSTGKGIPYYGETVVDVDASNTGVNRKLRIQVPNK